mgnify:CR=1 FL=1
MYICIPQNLPIIRDGKKIFTKEKQQEITFVGNATAGSITIYDNTAGSGRVVWSISFHTSNVPCSIDIPGEGIRCEGNVTANCTGATAVVFYG